MQNLACYSLETKIEPAVGERRMLEIDKIVDSWLISKGADNPRLEGGSFESKSGDGVGQFSRRSMESPVGNLREIELIETAHNGAMFSTTMQIAHHSGDLAIYSSLSATPGAAIVAPMRLYPRCPGVLRTLIEEFKDWKFNEQPIPLSMPFDATNEDTATQLCYAIKDRQRRFPIVVISVDEDEVVWQDLPSKLAFHLVGLADVAFVDAESSWILTDRLGKQNSCYLGAVRLYWPGASQDGGLWSVTWTSPRLASFGEDEPGMNRFLSTMRQLVMSAAALTMSSPKMVREIQQEVARQRLKNLEKDAFERELNSIVEENSRLAEELEAANRKIAGLQWKLQAMENRPEASNQVVDSSEDDEGEANTHVSPKNGELRYYKKIGSGGGVDTLVVTKACNHKASSWRPAFKADQAEKGIMKLEDRSDWQSIAHCSACTGGGRWRVQW